MYHLSKLFFSFSVGLVFCFPEGVCHLGFQINKKTVVKK